MPCLSDPDPDLAGDLPGELGVRGAPKHSEVEAVPPGAVEGRLKRDLRECILHYFDINVEKMFSNSKH